MVKKCSYALLTVCIPLFFCGAVLAQTFDGRTPAEEEDCDSLTGAAYGLCVAFCEAQDCDVNVGQPSCDSLRKNFQKKTGSTIFPCEARCGDGVVSPGSGEACDDGNAVECDGCSSECEIQNQGDPGCESPDPECSGQTCETFTTCNAGGSCFTSGVCGSLAEGGGLCVDGSTQCAGLLDCVTSADCPDGGLCFVNSCCTRAVCVPTDRFCSNP